MLGHLGIIDFWFVAEQRRVHKTVHHYLLEAEGGELSDDDIEVVEVAWVPLDDVPARLAYADERRLVARVPEVLDEHGATPGTALMPRVRTSTRRRLPLLAVAAAGALLAGLAAAPAAPAAPAPSPGSPRPSTCPRASP